MVSFRNRPVTSEDSTQVTRTGTARIPTRHGEFVARSYRDDAGLEHIAYIRGEPAADRATLVRVHSECLTGDVLGSLRCDCGSQLQRSLERIAGEGEGVLVYVRGHEGRGIGLGHKMRAYDLQDDGLDTVDANHALGFPADAREYGVAAAILADIGATRIRLLSNNSTKVDGLARHGLIVHERIPLAGETTPHNERYLETKRVRLAHALEIPGANGD